MKGDLKAPRPCIARGVKRQKGANPNKVRHQILNISIMHIVYYNIIMKFFFFNVKHEEIRFIKLFQNKISMV